MSNHKRLPFAVKYLFICVSVLRRVGVMKNRTRNLVEGFIVLLKMTKILNYALGYRSEHSI